MFGDLLQRNIYAHNCEPYICPGSVAQALLTAQTLEAEAKAKSARLSKLDEQKSRVFGAQEKHQKRVDDLAREIQVGSSTMFASF